MEGIFLVAASGSVGGWERGVAKLCKTKGGAPKVCMQSTESSSSVHNANDNVTEEDLFGAPPTMEDVLARLEELQGRVKQLECDAIRSSFKVESLEKRNNVLEERYSCFEDGEAYMLPNLPDLQSLLIQAREVRDMNVVEMECMKPKVDAILRQPLTKKYNQMKRILGTKEDDSLDTDWVSKPARKKWELYFFVVLDKTIRGEEHKKRKRLEASRDATCLEEERPPKKPTPRGNGKAPAAASSGDNPGGLLLAGASHPSDSDSDSA